MIRAGVSLFFRQATPQHLFGERQIAFLCRALQFDAKRGCYRYDPGPCRFCKYSCADTMVTRVIQSHLLLQACVYFYSIIR